jgi:hypothetical protein
MIDGPPERMPAFQISSCNTSLGHSLKKPAENAGFLWVAVPTEIVCSRINGAPSRNRTGKTLRSADFKSAVFTNFTIGALWHLSVRGGLHTAASDLAIFQIPLKKPRKSLIYRAL